MAVPNTAAFAVTVAYPVLCGWSYGPLVFLDYIRHYGEDRIGGLQFVGAVTKLGSAEAMAVLSAEFLDVDLQDREKIKSTIARFFTRTRWLEPIPTQR